ncbi:MAG: hypothetical protein RR661_02550, partial [Anaerovoracaceae bacterium]
MDASAMVLGTLCANIAFSLYGAYNLLNDKIMKVNFNKNYIVKALKYSLPILPHDLSNTIGTYLSKIILNTNISYASSGLFTVSSQISSIMNLVQASINLAFRPWFNEEIQKGEGGRKNIKRFSIITFSLYSAASIIISFFSQELLYFLVPQEYHEAWKITP